MRPIDNEPLQRELEKFTSDEELAALDESDVPEEVKSEILERIEGFEEGDEELQRPEDARKPV